MKERIEVVGAVITYKSKILCMQRSATMACPLKWEFPGGKIEKGETPRQALQREIREELNCEIHVGDFIIRTEYNYPASPIALSTYHCTLTDEAPELVEHEAMRWLFIDELLDLDWASADIPAVKQLVSKQ